MTESPAPPLDPKPGRATKTLGCLLLLLGIPFLLCSGMVSWVVGRQVLAKTKFDRQVQQLQQRGMPIDNDSLEQFRAQRSDGTNAERWMQLLSTLDSQRYQSTTQGVPVVGVTANPNEPPPAPGEAWQHQAAAEKFLARWSSQLETLHEIATGSGPIRTDIDYQSFETLFPYVQATRSAVRLLGLEHRLAVQQGDGSQAFTSILAMLGTARTLDAEPTVIAQMVRSAVALQAFGAVQRSVEHDLLSDQQLREIDQQLDPFDDHLSSFQMAIWGERALALPMFARTDPTVKNMNPLGTRYTGAVEMLKWYEKVDQIATSGMPADPFLDSIAAVQANIAAASAKAGPLGQLDQALVSLAFPALDAQAISSVRLAMQSRFVRAGVRVRLFRHVDGDWPDTLEDLTKLEIEQADLTPTGGRPFGYRVEGEVAVLWGFEAKSSQDQTPAEPLQPKAAGDQNLESWHWYLQP